ncbi:MAG: M42 family metallopeptidase [Lachnospiraceae bacterium]|nr:M42 family metallopeptidase [Lachnospiraceae bacterium]
MKLNLTYVTEVLREIMAVDSPSGYTAKVMDVVEKKTQELGFGFEMTNKGNGVITVPGEDPEYVVGFSAHVDTLGLMVRSIKPNGALAFTVVGGPVLTTYDSELCRVHTRDGRVYDGTVYSTHPAKHVFKESGEERNDQNLEVRLDEDVTCKEDVLKLGIQVGDYICLDPKLVITPSGFIKSRFLDDKLSVAILLGLLEYLAANHKTPSHTIKIMLSTYEEVGHGMSWIPQDIQELIAVDMGCVGSDLSCNEKMVSICAKDSSGPYDYEITSRLAELAREEGLDYAIDIYPYYSSDVSAALKGGQDIRGGLVGPGVFASHAYERSSIAAVENTLKLLIAYVLN